jgi:hypothetical protein
MLVITYLFCLLVSVLVFSSNLDTINQSFCVLSAAATAASLVQLHISSNCSQTCVLSSLRTCRSDWNAVKRKKVGCIILDIINLCGYVIGQSQLRILLRLTNMFGINLIGLTSMYGFIYMLLGQASHFIQKT